MRRLGLVMEGEAFSPQLYQAYIQLFERPLSDLHIHAIWDLFPC